MTAIEGKAPRRERRDQCSKLKHRNESNAEPRPLNVEILAVFAPTGAVLQSQSVMIIPLTMNNASGRSREESYDAKDQAMTSYGLSFC